MKKTLERIYRLMTTEYGQEETDAANRAYDDLKKRAGKDTVGEGVDFERIRRITGYLVGDSRRWNDAKAAELRDRVKHSVR